MGKRAAGLRPGGAGCIALVLLMVALPAGPAQARGGGGCLEEGTPIVTPRGPVPVERLAPGDAVVALVDGKPRPAAVQAVTRVYPTTYLELSFDGRVLRVTPDHPLAAAPEAGVFRMASFLRPGDRLWKWDGGRLLAATLESVRQVPARRPAYNLLVSPGGNFLADGLLAHNKGCFLPDTPLLRADGSEVPIRDVRPGDRLLAFTPGGTLTQATVRDVFTHQADEYVVVTTATATVRATREHPFYVGNGTFLTLESLGVGRRIWVCDGRGLRAEPVISIERIRAPTRVYNLRTDEPHTYFASGVAVHNKGGGCFPAGTPVLTPSGEVAIQRLSPGDSVLAVDGRRRIVRATVEATYAARSPILVLETGRGPVRTTAEQPFLAADGRFCPAGELAAGDVRLLAWAHREIVARASPATICWGAPRFRPNQTSCPTQECQGCQLPGVGALGVLGILGVLDSISCHNPSGHLLAWAGGRLGPAPLMQCPPTDQEEPVFGLQVDGPHTFIAAGFIVHNKGGGGFGGGGFHGGGYHSGGGAGGGGDPTGFVITVGVLIAIIILWKLFQYAFRSKTDEDLDYNYSQADVMPKARKTESLLEFIAKQDAGFAPDRLRQTAGKTFVLLQQCWEKRDYGPMKPLMMPDLYAQHLGQIQGMVRNHEVNRIAALQVERIDIVNVRYTHEQNRREFTALITASAMDYYVDDRDGSRLRGDEEPARFQEFWTFQCQDGAWLLREIEQTRESDVLKDENFFEQMTDQGLKQIYGGAKGEGPAGPWLEAPAGRKATRIERMLNFLVQTDKLWDRQAILERARQVFLKVCLARESGDPAAVPAADLFPDVAAGLEAEIRQRQAQGLAIAYRNLCVRKVDLLLVRNRRDNTQDEFLVRISAHAQQTATRGGQAVFQQAYVTPFEQYLTFGRIDGGWKLKAVESPARGLEAVAQENIDEDSTPEQVQWYYKHTRAV